MSFPQLGYDGPADVTVAMFSFPSEESYRRYREMVATDPEVHSGYGACPGDRLLYSL